MNHKQYEQIDQSIPSENKRFYHARLDSEVISSYGEFEELQKKYPDIPDHLWPQCRSEATDPDHVGDIAEDMKRRHGQGNPHPQKTPVSFRDLKEEYKIAEGEPFLLPSDGNSRIAAAKKNHYQSIWGYIENLPKDIFEAYAGQLVANNHDEISKRNTLETFQSRFKDLLDGVRNKTISKQKCIKSCTNIGKAIYDFESKITKGVSKERSRAKREMKKNLQDEWGMSKEDAAKLLSDCIKYDHSEVSFNADVPSILNKIGVSNIGKGQTSKNLGYELNKAGDITSITVAFAHADHFTNAFHKAEDLDMNAEGFDGHPLSSNVVYNFAFGYKFRQNDFGKNPKGKLTTQRSKVMDVVGKKIAYRGTGLKINIGKILFMDQIKNKESKILEIPTNNGGSFPNTKKGVYDAKRPDKVRYTGF